VRKPSHFQMPLENPSIQTYLVLLCGVKRLCIFGPKGAIQIRYYYIIYLKKKLLLLLLVFLFHNKVECDTFLLTNQFPIFTPRA